MCFHILNISQNHFEALIWMCGIIIPMRIQVRLSQASDIVERSKITQVYINEVINIVNDDKTLYIVEKNPCNKPSRMVMILVWLLDLDQCIVYVANHSFQSMGHFTHNNLCITIRSLYSLIWDFYLSQIYVWTTTTWSSVWVVLLKPSWYEFLIGFLIWTPAPKYLQLPTFSNIYVILFMFLYL